MGHELSADEKAVLDLLLSQPFPGRDELVRQVPFVSTAGLSCNCGCPSIALEVTEGAPHANVNERVPVSGHGRDSSGNLVGVLLFVDDGLMSELEFFSYVDPPPGFPKLETLRVDELTERGPTGIRWLQNDAPG